MYAFDVILWDTLKINSICAFILLSQYRVYKNIFKKNLVTLPSKCRPTDR